MEAVQEEKAVPRSSSVEPIEQTTTTCCPLQAVVVSETPSSSPPVVGPPCGSSSSGGLLHIRFSRLTKSVRVEPRPKTGLLLRTLFRNNNNNKTHYSKMRQRHTSLITTTTATTRRRTILHQVSGAAAPGEMLALMGPSGAGKTTLLNVLSGRTMMDTTGSHGGSCLSINGRVLHSSGVKALRAQIAYVTQYDSFLEHLTVRDQLTYTALLRLPRTMSKHEKLQEVDRIIALLHLTWVADSQLRVLSGGERKRTTVGSELLTDPKILLCDEPCSGLDSTSAVGLLKVLYDLAHHHGKTVITSIHQPSSSMFHYSFDKLLMLCQGHVVYFGTPIESIAYLKSHLFVCPETYNAADYWMDVLLWEEPLQPIISEDKSDQKANDAESAPKHECGADDSVPASLKGSTSLADCSCSEEPSSDNTLPLTAARYLISAWPAEAIAEQMDAANHKSERIDKDNDMAADAFDNLTTYNVTWLTQFSVLMQRCLKSSRSSIFTRLNMLKSVAIGAVVGCLWFQVENTEKTTYDRSSFWFFSIAYWVFDSMFVALLAFPTERSVVQKERASGTYRLSAFFFAKTTSETPARLVLPLLYLIVAFWMSGMNASVTVFFATTGCTLLSVLAGESIGLLVGASFHDTDKAVATATVLTLGLMLLGGFYVDNVPAFCQWVKFVSPFKYAYDATLQLVFDEDVPCDGSGLLPFCKGLDVGYATPGQVLSENLHVQGSVGFNAGVLVLLCAVARMGAYLTLRFTKTGGYR